MLSRLGLVFEAAPSGIVETNLSAEPPELAVIEWARKKAEAAAAKPGQTADQWYLGVDTIVVLDHEVLGKPGSRTEARSHLRKLSGRWHEVFSGYCLYHPAADRMVQNVVKSEVRITELTPEEIEAYLDSEEPNDKAGAYGVQGIGAFMVAEIKGSYTNVVGLPLAEVVSDLVRLGVIAAG